MSENEWVILIILIGVLFVVNGIIFGAFSAQVARSKNRSTDNWFVCGFFFGLIALIAVCGVMPKTKEEVELEKAERQETHMKLTGKLDSSNMSEFERVQIARLKAAQCAQEEANKQVDEWLTKKPSEMNEDELEKYRKSRHLNRKD
jgi:tellurite resistance protein